MDSIFCELEKETRRSFDRLIVCADLYTQDIFRQVKDTNALLQEAEKQIIECIDTLVACSEYYPEKLFEQVKNLEDNAYCLLDIITLYAQNSKEHKTYQYIRDYNGAIRVAAKQYPPSTQKGSRRDTSGFKSYDRKLYNSISRSKQKVFELAICNDWQYFVTFTINKKYYDRYDLEAYIKAFTKWLSNYSTRKTDGEKIDYLLIPELGKKGAWHLHGLMNGIPRNHLSFFQKGKHPQFLVDSKYLNWRAYETKFGYCSFGKIRSVKRVAGYITKYIRKSSITQERKMHSKLYYNTHGLKRSTEICRGEDIVPLDSFDFENEYVGIKWLNSE